MWPEGLPTTFHVGGRHSVNFCELFMQPADLPSTFVNFPSRKETFCRLSSSFVRLVDLPSTFIAARKYSMNFPYGLENFRQILSTFRAPGRHSINFRQLYMQPEDLSIFRIAGRAFVKFRQLFVLPGDFPSTSVNITCGWETFHQLPSSFCAAVRHSMNFRSLSMQPEELRQLFVQPRDLPSTFINFPIHRVTFCQISSRMFHE